MKKILFTALVVLAMSLAGSLGYSQDTTTAVPPSPVPEGASLASGYLPKKSINWSEKIDMTFSLQGRSVSGYTEYHIKFPTSVWHWEDTTWVEYTVNGQSVLAFPLDGYRIGALANSRLRLSKKTAIMLEFAFSTVLSQPNEAMVDSDYVDLSSLGSFSNWVNGATRSTVRYSNYDISVSSGFPLFTGSPWEVIPTVGFQTSKDRFDVMGLAGWYNVYGYRLELDSSYYAGINVLDYEVTYSSIMTGAHIKTNDRAKVGFSLKALYFPWVKATDYDDHLLRFKEASTEAKGNGYSLEGAMKILVFTSKRGSTWVAGCSYSVLRIKATGSQQQRFYADDPDTPEIETDYIFDPIDNTLKQKQNDFMVFVEYNI